VSLLEDWAWLLFDALEKAGVQDVIISPGSRSTPFVLAAARHPKLRCHDVIDERSAAFFALGQARVKGRPSLLLCTSGTAGAHYLPAILEAGAAHVPLLVLTADRPLELQDCAAPQTLDQTKLFGSHVRAFVELGLPDDQTDALRALRRRALQAVFTCTSPVPGAVHLNARARKPLEPVPDTSPEAVRRTEQVRNVAGETLTVPVAPRLAPDATALAALARRIQKTERGLIVCGPAPLTHAGLRTDLARLAAATSFPVLCEAPSQLRFVGDKAPREHLCDAFDTFLRSPAFRRRHAPELILQLGAPPTSKRYEEYLAEHATSTRVVIAPHGWNDPQSTAATLLISDVAEAVRALVADLPSRSTGSAWARAFAAANETAWAVVQGELRANECTLSEGHVASAVVASLRGLEPAPLLALGNSLPLRQVDTFCPAPAAELGVLSQRGASGIDGLISAAAGAASVAEGPVTLLLGDVSFLHDLGGLFAARTAKVPLVVVVVQNDGGRIFEQLPLARSGSVTDAALAHFTTPHGLNFSYAAHLFGHRYQRVSSCVALRQALEEAHGQPGCTVIEAVVSPHGAAEQQARLHAAVCAALEGAAP
jgi:2-succinyl-5-enolpyruvyl-6-hydroxy-3-cyclohexene-1-carboxylate synthase